MATISENLQTLTNIKSDIKNAIETKGVVVGDTSFGGYANKIIQIGSPNSAVYLPPQIKFAHSGWFGNNWYFPSNLKLSKTYNHTRMFSYVDNIMFAPALNLEESDNNFSYMFKYANFNLSNNEDMWNSIDYSKCSNIEGMFEGASLSNFNEFVCDSTNIRSIFYLFYYCSGDNGRHPTKIEFSNCNNIDSISGAFSFYDRITNPLTSFRMPNIGKAFTSAKTLDLKRLKFANRNVIVTLLSDLYDMTSKGFTNTLTLYADDYALLTPEDIAIATNKNWNVTSTTS